MTSISLYFIISSFLIIFATNAQLTMECSIISILTGRREQTDECNLKELLIKEMDKNKPKPWDSDLYNYREKKEEKRVPGGLDLCGGPGAICKRRGVRTCICPPSYVCDPTEDTVHSCVKLQFLGRK